MTHEQRSAIFRRAAKLVKAGWCQFFICEDDADGNPRRCLLGAVSDACGEVGEVSYPLRGAIEELTGMDAAKWNDATGRTQAEVVELLERLAGDI